MDTKGEIVTIPQKRIVSLDIARTVAIIFVVLCHSVELIYNMNMQNWLSISLKAKIFRTAMFTCGRLGVPIFLLLSGYFLLSKNYEDDKAVFKFYKKNLLAILITTEIWIVIYNIFLKVYDGYDIKIMSVIREMFFIEYVPLMNMWYMPMIIGMYIAIPFLSKVIHSFSLKTIKIPMTIAFLIVFVNPTLNVIFQITKINPIGNVLDVSFLGGIYGMYMILGYLSHENKFEKINNKVLILMSVISFICACLIQGYSYHKLNIYNIWYDSPFLLIGCTCLFELIKRLKTEKMPCWTKNIFTYISKISFAIFFIHIIVETILKDYIKLIPISNHLRVLMLFGCSFLICVLVVWILSKIKIIRKRVLFFKD